MLKFDSKQIGEFQEVDYGKYFSYRKVQEGEFPQSWIEQGFDKVITFVDDNIRLAKVLKTVVYIVTDEDEEGNPVVDKWNIKKHYRYENCA